MLPRLREEVCEQFLGEYTDVAPDVVIQHESRSDCRLVLSPPAAPAMPPVQHRHRVHGKTCEASPSSRSRSNDSPRCHMLICCWQREREKGRGVRKKGAIEGVWRSLFVPYCRLGAVLAQVASHSLGFGRARVVAGLLARQSCRGVLETSRGLTNRHTRLAGGAFHCLDGDTTSSM